MTTPKQPTGSRRHPRLVGHLHLVLTHHWYDETINGRKLVEYRSVNEHWKRLIWDRKDQIKTVTFSRGYSKTATTRDVLKIDCGPCPIPGWDNEYYRVHFLPNVKEHAPSPVAVSAETGGEG